MKKNVIVIVCVIVLVAAVAWVKNSNRSDDKSAVSTSAPAMNVQSAPASQPVSKPLPRLVDLGAHKCIPCKMMAPILKELESEYAGRAEIQFIDVWKNPQAGDEYGIRMIPTQIFYDRTGKEVWRHEGFLAKEKIVTKLKELGA